ncbi:hypothetical protein FRC04_007271 [Tulasnella sp. 424]|nr:hypothetical protein FRC04_007271 [Tulasnella sp. 424]KAG8976201.1 hypothetical protein FRC05_004450 [Tulasnella sp. 425]
MWTVQLLRIVFTNTFVFLFLTTSVLLTVNNNVGFIDFGSLSASTILHPSPPSPPPSSTPSTILDSAHHHQGDDSSSSDTNIVTSEDGLINYREQDLDHLSPSEASYSWLDISPVEIEAGKEDADASQGVAIERTDTDRSPVKTKAGVSSSFGEDIYVRPVNLDDFKLSACVAMFSLTVLAFLGLRNTYGRQSLDYFVTQLRVPLLLSHNEFLANGLDEALANVKKEEWKNKELRKMVEQAYQELVKLDKASADSRTKAELKEALKRSHNEVDESKRDAVQRNALVDKLHQDLERESTKNTDLMHRLQLSQADLRRLTHSDKEREEEMATANQDRLNAIAEARNYQDETTALRAEIESAQRDLETSRRDAEAARNEARAIRIENVSLRNALIESREGVSALQESAEDDVERVRAGLEEQKAINGDLNRILAEYKQGLHLSALAPLTQAETVTSLEDVQNPATSPCPETTSGLSDEEPTGAEPAQQQDVGSGEGAATPFDFETRDDLDPSQTAVDVAEPQPEPSQTQSATAVNEPTSTSTSAPAPDQAGGSWRPALGFTLDVARTTSFPKYEPSLFGLSFGHQDNNSDVTTMQYEPVQSNSEACGGSSDPIGFSTDEGEPLPELDQAQSAIAVDAEGPPSTPAPAPHQAGSSWLPAFDFTLNVPRATSFPKYESGLFGLSSVSQCGDSKPTTEEVDEEMSDEDAEGEDDSGWDAMEMDEDRSTPADALNVPAFDAVPVTPPIPVVPSVPIVPSMPMDTSMPLDSSMPSDPDLISAAIATWQSLFPAGAPILEGNPAALFDALLGPNNVGTWNEQPAVPEHTGPLPTSSQDSVALTGALSTVNQQWQQSWLDGAFQPLPDPDFGISSTQQPSFTPNVVPPMGNIAQQPLGDGAGDDSLFDWIFGATTQLEIPPPDSNASDPVDTSLLNNITFIPPEPSQWSGTPTDSNPLFMPLAQAPPYPLSGPLLDPAMDIFTFGQLLPVGDIAPNTPSPLNSTPPSVPTPVFQPPTLDAFAVPPPTVFPFIPIGEPLSIDPSLSVDEPVTIPAPVAADDSTPSSYTGPAGDDEISLGDDDNNDDEIWRQICAFADESRASAPSLELGPRTPVEQDHSEQNSESEDEEFEDLLAKIATPAAGDVIIPLSPSPTPASEPLTPSPNAQVASRGANAGSAGKVKRGVSFGSRSQNEDAQEEEEDEFPPAVYIPKHDRLIRGMPMRLKKSQISKADLSFQGNPAAEEVDWDSGTSADAWGAGDAYQDCPVSHEPPRTETGKRAIRPLPKSRRRAGLPVTTGCVDGMELGGPTEQSEDTWQTFSPLPTSPEMESNLHPSFGECYRSPSPEDLDPEALVWDWD